MNSRDSQTAQMTPPPAVRARAMQAYAAQSRALLEEKWILDHLPLVKHIVNKVMVDHTCPDYRVVARTKYM